MKSYSTIEERLQMVNNPYTGLREKSVWDCVDKPMRPLVFELNRIGMITKFSCCGFVYLEEDLDEPKSHIRGQAYVQFYVKNTTNGSEQLKKLAYIISKSGWEMMMPFLPSNKCLITIRCRNTVPNDLYYKGDDLHESIHQYEAFALQIQHLTYLIQEHIKSVSDTVEIIDGNSYYDVVPFWQVLPKPSWSIKIDEYYKRFGKVKSINCDPLPETIMDVSSYFKIVEKEGQK